MQIGDEHAVEAAAIAIYREIVDYHGRYSDEDIMAKWRLAKPLTRERHMREARAAITAAMPGWTG